MCVNQVVDVNGITIVSFADVLGSGPEHHEGVRRERLASLDQATPEVQRRKKKKKVTKLQRQSTLIRREVESLPTFWPVFIILLSIGQVSQSLSASKSIISKIEEGKRVSYFVFPGVNNFQSQVVRYTLLPPMCSVNHNTKHGPDESLHL